MIEKLRAIQEVLNQSDGAYGCMKIEAGGDESCLLQEEERPLKASEKALGWSRRPYYSYNPDNLCCSCRAYWHVGNAITALERHEVIKTVEQRG